MQTQRQQLLDYCTNKNSEQHVQRLRDKYQLMFQQQQQHALHQDALAFQYSTVKELQAVFKKRSFVDRLRGRIKDKLNEKLSLRMSQAEREVSTPRRDELDQQVEQLYHDSLTQMTEFEQQLGSLGQYWIKKLQTMQGLIADEAQSIRRVVLCQKALRNPCGDKRDSLSDDFEMPQTWKQWLVQQHDLFKRSAPSSRQLTMATLVDWIEHAYAAAAMDSIQLPTSQAGLS